MFCFSLNILEIYMEIFNGVFIEGVLTRLESPQSLGVGGVERTPSTSSLTHTHTHTHTSTTTEWAEVFNDLTSSLTFD